MCTCSMQFGLNQDSHTTTPVIHANQIFRMKIEDWVGNDLGRTSLIASTREHYNWNSSRPHQLEYNFISFDDTLNNKRTYTYNWDFYAPISR